jgi:hypothetical protein
VIAMAKYIKREAAMDIFGDVPMWQGYYEPYPWEVHCAIVGIVKLLKEEISKIPAADVAPVVHCKDCRYWGDADGISTNVDGVRFARCRAHNHYVAGMHIGWCYAEDDFCSYGAREDGDSDGE